MIRRDAEAMLTKFLVFRALSMIYSALKGREADEEVQVRVSYMEIYQDIGYDLLSSSTKTNSILSPFPKVYYQVT